VTGDLDTESGLSIMRLLTTLSDKGMTSIFVARDPRAAKFADRVITLRDGRLLGD
jgi:ABC-type lipoprotein export system ATPase subunit